MISCDVCGKRFQTDGDGELLDGAVCHFLECPVEGTVFLDAYEAPLNFGGDTSRDYELDFFDTLIGSFEDWEGDDE